MSAEELRSQISQKEWEDEAFKARLLADPIQTVEETFGYALPANIEVTVLEETADRYYLVIPQNPADIDDELTLDATPWN